MPRDRERDREPVRHTEPQLRRIHRIFLTLMEAAAKQALERKSITPASAVAAVAGYLDSEAGYRATAVAMRLAGFTTQDIVTEPSRTLKPTYKFSVHVSKRRVASVSFEPDFCWANFRAAMCRIANDERAPPAPADTQAA